MDMTPNNITGMAKLLGLDIIALTDHNTSLNCEATIAAGKENGVVVVPGMDALEWSEYVDNHRIKIKNRPDIYGRQVIMNALDEEIGELEHLLLPATEISIMNAYSLARSFGGICYPAHVDRDSLSILSVLGEIDESCGFITAELADKSKLDTLRRLHPILDTLNIVTNSDAHYLENMRDAENQIELEELSAECLVERLNTPLFV